MPEITIKITGDKELVKDLQRIGSELENGLENVLDSAAEAIKREEQHQAPVSTGALRDSIDVIGSSKGQRVIGPSGSTGSGHQPDPRGYALYIEDGNAPHFPPISSIADRLGVSEWQAYQIAKKIADQPGRASHFISTTAVRARELFYEMVDAFAGMITK